MLQLLQLERAANYARIMEELTLLGSFVRLADYLLVEGVMARAVAGVEELLALLTNQKQQVRCKACLHFGGGCCLLEQALLRAVSEAYALLVSEMRRD